MSSLRVKYYPSGCWRNFPLSAWKNTSTRRYINEFLRENQVVLNPEIELATSDMLVQFARRNLGVASVVEDFAMPSLTGGELFRLVFDCPIPERFMYLMLDKKIPCPQQPGS